jgi:predicted Zn-dependent protease
VYEQTAVDNLQIAMQQDSENPFGWYQMAQAYSDLGNGPMADLSTAERYYSVGDLRKSAIFAMRSRQKLTKGSPDWERANDIVAVAVSQMKQQRGN